MIKISNLSHEFRVGKKGRETRIEVLKDVSLNVEKGEILTIAGRSGSGKSTLLNLISGFIKPRTGDIFINGTNVGVMTEAESAAFRIRNIGVIFQNFQLIPSMTAYDNVELPLILKGVSEAERKIKALNMLSRMGLTDFRDHYPSELSGGQQQRVSIARALVVNPPLILADEPTGSLDSETEDELLGIIRELNEELGITFVIITHDEKVANIGDRIIMLKDGMLSGEEVFV
ncbi:ABC transporter ATP-binding protein [Peribacillus sp. SCS-37]|uniref:ABC transporter ATP-binding protein n=1 Tax=Paraperibacillus esterisolvens TaxID=3115296 RepID=UPI003906929B